MRLSVGSLQQVVKRDLPIEFVPQQLTSYGGLELLRRYVRRLDLPRRLRTPCTALGGDYSGARLGLLVLALLYVGARRLEHLRYFADDPLVRCAGGERSGGGGAGVGVLRTAVPSTGPLYRLMLLSPEQTAEIAKTKQVIYDGFKAAVAGGVPRDRAGILVDEQFGAAILEFDELVPGSRSEMIDLLSGARAGNSVGAISYVTNSLWHHLPSAQRATLDVRAKVGFTGPNTHTDAAIVKQASAAGDVRYTVAILNAADPNTAEATARALDITLVASHQPSPSP